jgi:outer membrane lipoprotein-sorting protein
MRRFALAMLVLVMTPLLMAGGLPAPSRPRDLSEADGVALDGISASLNRMATLKGDFVQVDPSGDVDQGAFYISKPGRMRFEYKPPSPTLIVSDGRTIAVANTRLNTVDRYPLSETPLGLVLGNDIDLRHSPALVSIQREPGLIVIGARSNLNVARANISLVFSDPGYELRQWTVIDNQGLTTTVALRDLVPGAALSPSLFQLPDKNPFARHPQD